MNYVYITEKNGLYEVGCAEHAEGAVYSESFEDAFSAKRRMKMLKTYSQQMLRETVLAKTQRQLKVKKDLAASDCRRLSPVEELDRILKNND